jgi:hypothetical protein
MLLDYNNIGVEGAKAISNNLKNLTTLDLGIFIIIVLDDNNIGVEGAKAISNNLINLTTLNLSIVIINTIRS